MRAKRIAQDEQFRLITQCRQSGLSDYQWCQMHDINPGTFYNWISRLRKRGYSIPVAETEYCTHTENRQEVVKIDLMPERHVSTVLPPQKSPSDHATPKSSSLTMEISVGKATIWLFHDADTELV